MKILNCPFFGSDEVRLIEGYSKSWVICEECGADGPMSFAPNDAIGRWNNAWCETGKQERGKHES